MICVLPILTLFFAVLSLKKKHFADWLMSLETLLMVVMCFRPMYLTKNLNYYFIKFAMAIFLLSGVNLVDIVITNLCFPLSLVVGVYIAHNKPLDREAVFLIIFTSIVMFILTMSFSFLVHYISALNKRILTVT